MSTFTASATVDADRSAWERITAASDDAWVGHTWEWNELIEEGAWETRRMSLTIRRGEDPVGIVPLHMTERRAGPLRRRILHSNWWGTGGIALLNDLGPQERLEARRMAMDAVHATARAISADKLLWRQSPLTVRALAGHADPDGLTAYGVHETPARAIVLRLAGRTTDDIWGGMAGRARTAIRKAERLRVTVERLSQDDAVERYYPMHLATYRRTGAPPLPQRYFDVILRSPWSVVFAARHEGAIVALVNVMVHSGRALYWTNASLEAASALSANSLLQWHAIQWMVGEGIAAYEMGEMPHEHETGTKLAALALYKVSFGGEPVPVLRAQRTYASLRERVVRVAGAVGSRRGL